MRQLAYGIALALVVAPAAYAAEDNRSCAEKYPIPNLNINFVEEKTGHNPLQYLLRRCLADERREAAEERRAERRRARKENRLDLGQERSKELLNRSRADISRKLNRIPQTRPYTLDRTDYNQARRSRRTIVRNAEGFDRINAIRRRLMRTERVDLCTEVQAIGSTSPCFNYGSYNKTQINRSSPYLQYFK